jgi:hypothetical protein
METIIDRLEAIHRALRTAPLQERRDERVADTVARCLRDLHAIAAQARAANWSRRPVLRLIDGARDHVRPVSRDELTRASRKSGVSCCDSN